MSDRLDNRLQQDSHNLGKLDGAVLLLSRNAYFPWFILVPETQETEFYKMDLDTQLLVLKLINQISAFIERHFSVDKLNVATIGNVVSQMHIHIVGRSVDDPCWPGVVWGCDQVKAYTETQLKDIRTKLESDFAGILKT